MGSRFVGNDSEDHSQLDLFNLWFYFSHFTKLGRVQSTLDRFQSIFGLEYVGWIWVDSIRIKERSKSHLLLVVSHVWGKNDLVKLVSKTWDLNCFENILKLNNIWWCSWNETERLYTHVTQGEWQDTVEIVELKYYRNMMCERCLCLNDLRSKDSYSSNTTSWSCSFIGTTVFLLERVI